VGTLILCEQAIISNFSQFLFACSFMQWAMILLAVDAAVFHEVTCTLLQFDIIDIRFAAGGAAHHRVGRRF
jgi:hypothetical protein